MNKLPQQSAAPHPLAGMGHESFPGANTEIYVSEDGTDHITYDYPGVGYVDCEMGGASRDGDHFVIDPDVLFIDDVTVREQARGNGFAGELISWALEDASTRGFSLCEVIPNNPAMVRVLEKLHETGRINEVTYAPVTSEMLKTQLPARDLLHTAEKVGPEEAQELISATLNAERKGGMRAIFTF